MYDELLKQNFDAVVVGTGPGGATAAKELAKRGRKVLMLEWGPARPVRGNFLQYLTEQLIPGKSLLLTPRILGMVRGITPGGSSLFYYGTCFPVPFDMLRERGVDIREEVAEARKELPIGPLKDEMMTPMATRILESARGLGYDWKKLDKFMYQDRWRPHHRFGYYGDPNHVKWSARMPAGEALRSGAALVDRAKVSRVILENGKAVGVEFKKDNRVHQAFGTHVILAAGGIGSAVILRRTGIPDVGLNYFYDPLISVCGKVEDLRKQVNEIPMSAGVHLDEQGFMMTDMALPFMLDKVFALNVFKFHRLFESRKTLRIMIKARDVLGGRLTDRGGVRKNLTPEDKAKLMDGYERAVKILEKAGAKGIYKTWTLAAHPGGTVKIGEHVDSRLQTRFENLYVCDCSVIPEPWGRPPTLTVIGLGKHLVRCMTGEKAAATSSPLPAAAAA